MFWHSSMEKNDGQLRSNSSHTCNVIDQSIQIKVARIQLLLRIQRFPDY